MIYTRSEFSRYHPAVVFCYFAAVIVLTFMSLQPMARIAGLLCAALIVGWQVGLRSLLRSCCFYIPLIIVVALFNSLFNPRGITVAFYFLGNPVTVEAIVYGASFGLMLATALLWFTAYQRMMSQQGFLALFSRIAPTIALMLVKVMAFVPNLLAQGRSITAARSVLTGELAGGSRIGQPVGQEDIFVTPGLIRGLSGELSDDCVCCPENPSHELPNAINGTHKDVRRLRLQKTRDNAAYAVRLSSQLLEWGMESSLITADSMRARGFGSTKRSSYRSMRLTHRDTLLLSVLITLIVGAAITTYLLTTDFSFYPRLIEMLPWWWHVPTVVLSLLPLLCEGGERLRWRFLR